MNSVQKATGRPPMSLLNHTATNAHMPVMHTPLKLNNSPSHHLWLELSHDESLKASCQL